MKHLKIVLFVLVCLSFNGSVSGQTVVKVKDPYILLEIGKDTDVQKDDILYIYRYDNTGKPAVVAKVQVVAMRKDLCAVKVLKKSSQYPVQPGDLVRKPAQQTITPQQDRTFEITPKEQSAAPPPSSQPVYRPQKIKPLTYAAFSAGLVISGLGYYYYDQAGITSTQKPSTSEEWERLQNLTDKYDNRANICLYAGGGLVAFSIIHYLLTRTPPAVTHASQGIIPVTRPGYSGLSYKLPL